MNDLKILVTGATGFIGKQLTTVLARKGFVLTVVVRKKTHIFPKEINQHIIKDLSRDIDWHDLLCNIDVIVHLAGKVHIVDSQRTTLQQKLLQEYKNINTFATLRLAHQAAETNVSRFIYMSSLAVNGKFSYKPFNENDLPNPNGPYAISKYEAELGLINLSKETALEVVVIRPPLVYGPDAAGNFGYLIQWANSKVTFPLPLSRIKNRRSFVGLNNLIDFIICCINHPRAANEVFFISDNQDLSTTEFLSKITNTFGKKGRLFPFPVSLMVLASKLIGKESVAVRLFSTLQVDISKARNLLGWEPFVTIDEQLAIIPHSSNKKIV